MIIAVDVTGVLLQWALFIISGYGESKAEDLCDLALIPAVFVYLKKKLAINC